MKILIYIQPQITQIYFKESFNILYFNQTERNLQIRKNKQIIRQNQTIGMFHLFSKNTKYFLAGISATFIVKPLMCFQIRKNSKQKKHEVYIWGNGFYQARPDAILQFKNFTPKKIKNLPDNLCHIQFGEFYDAGIDKDGNLFIWNSQNIDANYQEQKKQYDQTRQNILKLEKNVKQVKFTTGYIWILNNNQDLIQYPITKQFDKNNAIISTKLGSKKVVTPLKGSIKIDTGDDHLIALKKDGQVYAMGDDTFGQCGQDDQNRNNYPPFNQNRVKFPVKVKNLKNIVKIASGANHNLALDNGGNLFGWGSNSNMQLSHEDEFSAMNTPLICTYKPIKISKGLDSNEIRDLAAGNQFSILVTTNRNTESEEVFTVGNNLKGQLGIGEYRHVKDITKVEALSNYVMKIKGKQQKVKINQLRCGKNHCIALLNIGYIMEWGDNQFGQMGNKKRVSIMTPIVMKQFADKKIVGVFAGYNKSGIIVQKSQDEQV